MGRFAEVCLKWATPQGRVAERRAIEVIEVPPKRHRPFTLDSIVPQHLFGDPVGSSVSQEGVQRESHLPDAIPIPL